MSRPVLLTGDSAPLERHASWLELFFDLVFVVAVAQLGSFLHHDHSIKGVLEFTLLFAALFGAWVEYTFYADRFETDDVSFRLMTGAMMLAVVVASVNVPHAFEGDGHGFAQSMVAVQAVVVLLYAWSYVLVPVARGLSRRYGLGFALSGLLWLASAFTLGTTTHVLWAAAVVVAIGTPLFSTDVIDRTPVHTLHIPERFGLFTIIVLGEAVVSVAAGTEATAWGLRGAVVGALGFLCAGTLWWVYFDYVDGEATINRKSLARLLYVDAHLPLLAGLTAFGVGVELAIVEAGFDHTPDPVRWLLCGGAAAFLLAQAWMHLTDNESFRDLAVFARVVTAIALLVLATVGDGLAPVWFLAVMLLLLVLDLGAEIVDESLHHHDHDHAGGADIG